MSFCRQNHDSAHLTRHVINKIAF